MTSLSGLSDERVEAGRMTHQEKKKEMGKKQRQPSRDTRLSPKNNLNSKRASKCSKEPEISAEWGSTKSCDAVIHSEEPRVI